MHIDYLKRVEKMLALPVERLVGNSSTSCNNNASSRRMSLSPDSSNSTTGSISSSSITTTISEHEHEHGGGCGESVKCHYPKISISPQTTKEDPLLQSRLNNNNDDKDKVRIKVESPEPPEDTPTIMGIHHHNRFSINNRKSGEDDILNHSDNHSSSAFMSIRPSALKKNSDHHQHHHDYEVDNTDDEGDIDVDGDDDKSNKVPTTIKSTVQKSTSPPCFNFKPFSVSTFGLNLSTNNTKDAKNETDKANCTTPPQVASLKFSIEDILKPDFGLTKFQLLAQQHHHHHHQIKRSRSTLPCPGGINSAPNRKVNRDTSSVSSSEGHIPYKSGPGSVIYHSEDSNGSCTSKGSSSRRDAEVVDDTKVNPPVPEGPLLWPAWVYCTRYSDRPSSGPRSRRIRKSPGEVPEEKRPRTAFTAEQLSKLKKEFDENRYLTEKRRQDLARDLKLHENQIKIWFQNKRAKLKKSTGTKNGLAMQLMAQGLYNHSTVPVDEDDEMMMEMM